MPMNKVNKERARPREDNFVCEKSESKSEQTEIHVVRKTVSPRCRFC